MEKSKIYTRTGDEGLTSLVGGKRVSKTNIRIDAYGTVDELNSFIACLIDELDNHDDRRFLQRIQLNLFNIGGYLASEECNTKCSVFPEEVVAIENEIDKIDHLLPPLKYFILPGGCRKNSLAHVCRTICRRMERLIYKIDEHEKVDATVCKYINRLSDFFFLFARKQNFINNIEEIIWKNPCK
ncbi:MAG: cob(I)yrinic acid a,c-diamide adenosyltransferase [Dysgonamonadaceae bacterium]|jgi:cob(I)alamin adenosyltransferase|nr:cob(I)yrinic acid a,c-diamide adenosyltransferase [Dysgonamonadaceae bacterium]